jgi:hypothetical protein
MEQTLFSFNRGKISTLSLARVDQERVNLSAETMSNFIPRTLGPMSLRPGWQYLFNSNSNNKAFHIPFIYANDDQAIVELTNNTMRVIVSDTVISRTGVSSATTNGTFDSNLTGWTDSDETGCTSVWVSGGYMGLTGNGSSEARRDQTVTIAGGDQNVEHALYFDVQRGPVGIRVGSTSGGDEYITETQLETGYHSLSFTPTGASVYIRIFSTLKRQVLLSECSVASSGDMTLTTPYATADLPNVRYDQSGDVVFVACKNKEWQRIERRATNGWSIVRYAPETGPFRAINTSQTTLTPGARTGNTTLTASQPHFKSTSVGALYRLTITGQTRSSALAAADTYTDAIRVSGVEGERRFNYNITGTWAGTITLQRSFTSEDGPWEDVDGGARTANTNETVQAAYDNTAMWFRAGFKSGQYGSGTATVTLTYSNGDQVGVCRVTGYTSATQVSVEIIEAFSNAAATTKWEESKFSGRRGWPTAVVLHEGRLWWAGKDSIVGSISDAFNDFDPDFEGDAGPISTPIGSGPVDTVSWLLSLQKMLLGGQGAEYTAQSSALDEPLTPSNFALRITSTQGSAAVQGVKLDDEGVFASRAGTRIYSLSLNDTGFNYAANDLTSLWPEAGSPGIVRIAVQRQPDTRIHCVRSDGTVLLGVMDRAENVLSWQDISTDGTIEDVIILNGTDDEDDVYYSVKRTINSSDVRFLEKWAREDQCRGGTLNRQGDAFKIYTGVATTSITGLTHLEGESVVVWADGSDVGTNSSYAQTYTVSSGAITLTTAASNVMVGMPYTAQWKSSRLPDVQGGKSLAAHTRVNELTMVMAWVHAKGLRYGPDFSTLDDLPGIEAGAKVDADAIRTTYAEHSFLFNGRNDVDARLCLQAQAPRPVTILAAVPDTSP